MAKRRIYKKSKNGEPIKVTARQLHQLSNIRDAKWALREFDDETLLGTWDKEIRFGYGKRVCIHYDGEDKDKYVFSLAYIPRALNDHDVNEAILRMYFVRRWIVDKRWLWA